jgi:hypothetical protein
MGKWADMKIIDAFRNYANARINFNIFGQSVPPLQMLEFKVCSSNVKHCEDKIDNIKRDLTLGISSSVLRGNGT